MLRRDRSFRATTSVFTVSLGLMLALAACGGVTGPEGPSGTVTVNGTVALPAGHGATLSSLTVTTPIGTYPVSPTGYFSAEVLSGAEAELGVETASGDLVLLGVSQGTSASLSVTSTAEALLYYLVGAMWLPAEHQEKVRSLLSGSPEAESLARQLERQLLAGGNGLAEPDGATLAAIEAAHASLLGDAVLAASAARGRTAASTRPTMPSPSSAAAGAAKLDDQTLLPLTVPGSNILIEPAGVSQAGAQVVHNPYGAGVVALNEFRRPAALLAYEVAWENADGVETAVSPPVLVEQVDVPATGQLEFFNALLDVVTGDSPWSTVMSDRLSLPGRAGASRTHYQLVLLGPTISAEVPPIMSDPRFTSFHAQWDDIIHEKSMELFLDELLLPLVEVYGLGALARYDAAKLSSMRDRVRTIADKHLLGLGEYLKQGRSGYADALRFAIRRMAESREFRLEMMETITEALSESDRNRTAIQAMEKRLAARASASAVAAAVQSLLVGGDVAKIMLDLADSPPAVDWLVITAPTLFAMTPELAVVSRDSSSAKFTVFPRGPVTGSFLYRWSTSGVHGTISDLFQDGTSFVTTSTEVWYFHDTPLSVEDGDVDSVIAEVFEVEPGATGIPAGAQPIARMAATVRGDDRQIDGRIVVTYGATPAAATHNGVRFGCAEMLFVFDAEPGAKSYTVRIQGVGGQGDPRNANQDFRTGGPNHTVAVNPSAQLGQTGYVGTYHGPCNWMRDGRYASPSPFLYTRYDAANDRYIVSLFTVIDSGGGVTIGSRVPLWYGWVDGATFQVAVVR